MNITYTDTRKDLPAGQLLRLFRLAGWSDGTETDEQKRLFNAPFRNSTLVVSAWDDELLVGAVRVLSDTILRSVIHDLIVDPEYQNRGIGQNLMKQCLAHFPGSEWVVATEASLSGYYRKLGFSPDARCFLSIPSEYF